MDQYKLNRFIEAQMATYEAQMATQQEQMATQQEQIDELKALVKSLME